MDIPQFHLYDLDDAAKPPYESHRDAVRARGGKNWAEFTVKRETENYIHPNCIQSVYGFAVAFGDMDDVSEIVASIQHNTNSPNPWDTLDDYKKKKKVSNAKRRLNSEVAKLMTWADLQVSDTNGDIIRWLELIRDRID